MRSEEIREEIKILEEKMRSGMNEIERRVMKKKIMELEKELYGIKQKEYVKYFVLDEKMFKERVKWYEESKRLMRDERKKNRIQNF